MADKEKCERCGYIANLEKHHIKHKIDGGSNDESNLRTLCRGCHDYQHAKETVLKAIDAEQARLKVLKRRLELIEELNMPFKIKERGYQSYFESYQDALPIRTKCGRA